MSDFFGDWKKRLCRMHERRSDLEKLRSKSAEDEQRYQDFVSELRKEEKHYHEMKERDRAYEASLRNK